MKAALIVAVFEVMCNTGTLLPVPAASKHIHSHLPRDPVYLGSPNGDRLSLRVLRYQFPGITRPRCEDSNWLMIQGDVQRPGRTWQFNDPCLLTGELQELIDWLRDLPNQPKSSVRFIEPLVELSVDPADAPWTVRVTLNHEALPSSPTPADLETWHEGLPLMLLTNAAERDRVVDALVEDLRRWPPR